MFIDAGYSSNSCCLTCSDSATATLTTGRLTTADGSLIDVTRVFQGLRLFLRPFSAAIQSRMYAGQFSSVMLSASRRAKYRITD